ncbi:MAG: hypothetical protein WCB67_10700 [Solirubrobacteraceae bacterium]
MAVSTPEDRFCFGQEAALGAEAWFLVPGEVRENALCLGATLNDLDHDVLSLVLVNYAGVVRGHITTDIEGRGVVPAGRIRGPAVVGNTH